MHAFWTLSTSLKLGRPAFSCIQVCSKIYRLCTRARLPLVKGTRRKTEPENHRTLCLGAFCDKAKGGVYGIVSVYRPPVVDLLLLSVTAELVWFFANDLAELAAERLIHSIEFHSSPRKA